MQNETITIENYPHCKKTHKYSLQVDRTIVFKLMTPNDMYERESPFRVTRFFSCPLQNQMFQATITLYQSSNNRIISVGDKTEIKNNS